MKKHAIGSAALVASLIALGLAIIPGVALERPFPLLDEKPKAPPTDADPDPDPDAKVTLKFKNFSVAIGKNDKGDNAGDDTGQDAIAKVESRAAVDPVPDRSDQLLKYFTIAAVSFSLVGLLLGPLAWVREKQPALSGVAMGLSCLALTWQYVVIGVTIGVAIAFLLIILSRLGG